MNNNMAFVSSAPIHISRSGLSSLCSNVASSQPQHVHLPKSRSINITTSTVRSNLQQPSEQSSSSSATSATPAPLVPILMGSASDMPYCEKISNALTALGIASELRVASAHKVPERLLSVIAAYEADPRPKVYIGVAGRSNALSGVLDCAVSCPVISCPPPSDSFAGADIYSSLRMPSGVAPAVILEPATAALMAAKIFGLSDGQIAANVANLQKVNRDRLYIDDSNAVTKTYMSFISNMRESDRLMTETNSSVIFGDKQQNTKNLTPITGKVRDRYELTIKDNGVEKNVLALVTTDRQSAFDRVLAAVPYKGAVLNLTSAWWFENTKHIIPNHIISVPHPYVTIAKRCQPFPIEFVVRGYITGSTSTSLWKNYSSGVRNYCGIDFPEGLVKNQKLDTNVLTPTTKSDFGDELIAPKDVVQRELMTQEDWDVCATAAMKLFEFGQQTASEHGLILVDTKYEFGRDELTGEICLIDEVHTPDSSRFWISTTYDKNMKSGKEPENIDKEFLRLWFQENCDPYDTSKQLPKAPSDLVDELGRRYVMLYELITGESFDIDAASQGKHTIPQSLQPVVSKMVEMQPSS